MKRATWLMIFVFLGIAIAVGCLQPVEVTGGQCQTNADCGDGNPCVDGVCEKGFCIKHSKEMGSPCGNELLCSGDGRCGVCTTRGDCPQDTECRTYKCGPDQLCVATNLPSSTVLDDTVAGDCSKSVCDGEGSITSTFDLTGTPCSSNGEKVCDGMGACVECLNNDDCMMGENPSCDLMTHSCISCSDGVQNGSEEDIDCGEMCPKHCDGSPCDSQDQCKSGHCVDSVCCSKGCDTKCKACNVPGQEGVCTTLSAGLQDPGQCGGTNVCNGMSGTDSCVSLTGNDKKNGDPCTNNNECFNNTCAAGICRLPNGEPCSDDVQCASLHCSSNTCSDCPAGMNCRALNGTPCGDNSDCESNNCNANTSLCVLTAGESCNDDHDCLSYYCVNQSCVSCTIVDGGTGCASSTCNSGVCALPTGAYCLKNGDCGYPYNCSGFPKKCL